MTRWKVTIRHRWEEVGPFDLAWELGLILIGVWIGILVERFLSAW